MSLSHQPLNPRRWWILVATGLCLGLSFLDQTAVVVIFPVIQKSLSASNLQMEWVINAYMLVMSVLFVLGGRLGDLYGEKRIFLWGMSVFLVASLFCGIAENTTLLIAARALQGVGSALLIPAQSVIILNAFPIAQRGRALGLNLSIASLFLVLGGFIGGSIAELLSWHMVFLINVPLCIISAILVLWAVTTDIQKTTTRPMDWLGLWWQLLAISALVLGIMELGEWPWLFCLSLFLISLVSFYFLYKTEIRKAHPLISFHIFKIKAFTTGCLMITFIQMVLVSGIFTTLFYQYVLGASPIIAGIMTLPGVIPVLLMGPVGGWLVDRFGSRLPLLIGLSLMVFSSLWTVIFLHLRDYWFLLPALVASGFGVPLIMNSIFATALNSIELHNRGLASGTLGMLRQVGSSVGLATASAIVNIVNHWSIQHQLAHSSFNVNHTLVQSIFSMPQLLRGFAPAQQTEILTIAKNALATAIIAASAWTVLVVITLWIIGFLRTKGSAGFLQKDRA